ncbi:MAG: 1,4-dihydroxy-2-naphthoate octaprenyltransferase [Flavobacteriales bacterium]|jgi:1,4-dihydroxy-2-naphthoate octaprenyltransferase|tara:strand:- start:839 stop:1741 length:903 start_codon:yes stop_codon:yes gene_type:complete
MKQLKVWLKAVRLRTLPLSVSGILIGNSLCFQDPEFSGILFVLMLFTAISFQIISNFANDYGDGVKGTDNDNRLGPKRVLQQGLLSREILKKGIVIISLISLLLAFVLIFLAFGSNSWYYILIFIGLSFASVWAAIFYTVGNKAYGYYGFGDLFVFLFFGGVSVLGAYFIQLKTFSYPAILLSLVVGFLSVGVLNLNNMRDIDNDAFVGKRTLVVIMGAAIAKKYHLLLLIVSVSILVYVFSSVSIRFFWIPYLAIIPLIVHFISVLKNSEPKFFDPELKKLSLSIFLLSLLVFLSFYLA